MKPLPFAQTFRDLIVYQKTRELAREIFHVSKTFPPEERYSLTDQLRRASRSIGAQIAEAWAKRRYEKHFVSKLTDADGERLETEHWLGTALDCGALPDATEKKLIERCAEIGRMLGSMSDHPEPFCFPSSRVRESEGGADPSDN